MKIRLYYPSLFVVLLFHASFITLPYWNDYYHFKYVVLFIVSIFLAFNYNVIFNKKYKTVNLILFMYLFMVLLSSYINKNNELSRDSFLSAIVLVAMILEVFLLFEYFSIKGKVDKLICTLYYLVLFYLILTDIIMIIKPTLYIEKGMYYLIGNKFTVSYLHLQCIILYLQKNKNNFNLRQKILLFIHCLITLLVCIYVECSTGIMGFFIMLLYIIIGRKHGTILKNPKNILLTILISSSILILFSGILNNKFIAFFIENILHEDITLTGRMTIYSKLAVVFSDHICFGYGVGSSFDIIMKTIGAPNTQNGVLECILEQGIISVSLLMVLIYVIFKKIQKSSEKVVVVTILYIYAVLSSIEITLDISFIIWLAIALVCSNEKMYLKTNFKKN
ncbi:hypothetical protein PTN97_10545 [Clostridium perfringens]|nr:hypothetical protein [Clostridium perfringens]